jgi:hypothetical protein
VKRLPTAQFAEFIDFFPPLELPFNLLPDMSQIPSDPLPLPGVLQDAYILPFESDEIDEFTEYVPYGRISGTKDFHAMIYWKAGVLRYEFILATYTAEGDPLSHAIVGGLRYEDEGTLHSVAVIHEDLSITIAEGIAQAEEEGLDPDQTQTYQMLILPSGIITYEMNEESKET